MCMYLRIYIKIYERSTISAMGEVKCFINVASYDVPPIEVPLGVGYPVNGKTFYYSQYHDLVNLLGTKYASAHIATLNQFICKS